MIFCPKPFEDLQVEQVKADAKENDDLPTRDI